jgi:F-type H+-transporting ATPase subunit delta
MSAAAGSAKEPDAAETARLIAQYPYPWPWGQRIEVETPRRTLSIKIPQDRPATKQHKLAYKIDTTPPDVPSAPSYFIGPAGKATHALFKAAIKDGENLDQIKSSLAAFAALYEAKREIKINLMNPRSTLEEKYAYVREVAGVAGCGPTVTEHLVALQKDKRLHKIGEINKNFIVLVAEHRKEKHGSIISAEPLSEKHYDAIYEKMKKLVKSDEKLIVTREVEPHLVGGFIIRIGNRAQDLSVQAQIGRMESHLKEFFAKNKAAVEKVLAV